MRQVSTFVDRLVSRLLKLRNRHFLVIDVLVLLLTPSIALMLRTESIASVQTSQDPPVTAPAIVDVLLPSATLTTTPQADILIPTVSTGTEATNNGQVVETFENTPTPEVTSPDFAEGAVQVHIVARQRAYMRITVDEKVEFEAGHFISAGFYLSPEVAMLSIKYF